VANQKRTRLVALTSVLSRLHPDLDHPAQLIADGLVRVDGRPVLNPAARVRADAAIRILRPRRLRGEVKLAAALTHFGIDVNDRIAVDIGAAAGGFTAALLAAGAARVYAVDTGHGQLKGWLRANPRVVNLERNLGQLDHSLIPDTIAIVTMDLSYLSIASAVPQLDRINIASPADLLTLVKPTFELRTATLATQPEHLTSAVRRARNSIEQCGWKLAGQAPAPATGARGALELFLHARR
jgi:23S rRNA (cytidine1920-2'-O)/16S rRNA (cytidine1409-2'-O)-methyltransferase